MAVREAPFPVSRINLAEEADFDLSGMIVKPAERAIVMNGERRTLQPRVMQVLVALAQVRPGVVSRDKLIEQCWDGRIVGDDALNRCVLSLRHLAQEFAPQPFKIETVPRIGHRLIEQGAMSDTQSPRAGLKRWRLAALIAALLVALSVGYLAWQQRTAINPASIAVLPFRNLSSGDPYFAEGVGEEVLGQLAREPEFRIAGRASSSQFGANPDIGAISRLLKVDYVLEGSVRTQGDRVRVNAGLIRTSDGVRMWTESYDGSLDDVFEIQRRIAGAIAQALKRKLLQAPVLSGPLVTNGEAYNLYLTARGLLRTRQIEVGGTAANLLRDAINIDPRFAPAWASLAAATQLSGATNGHEGVIAASRHAQAYARHALRLAPDLAEAHRTMGSLLAYGTPQMEAHFRRAAELDPNDAENMIWLGVAHGAAAEFEAELTAYRRATELDPLWFRTVGQRADALAEMGDRNDAEAIVRRAFPDEPILRSLLLAQIAVIFGDFSEGIRLWSVVDRYNSPRWGNLVQRNINFATSAVGLKGGPLVAVPPPPNKPRMVRIRMDAPPSPVVWQRRNRDRIAADVFRAENHMAAKFMLSTGRTNELTAAYRGSTGLLGLQKGVPLRVNQLGHAPVVAIALRQTGQAAEAARLLREADALVRATYRRGRVPFWFDADTAAIWAAQGRTDEALAMLERAVGRGWTHTGGTDMRDIAEEPAFRSLRDEPRFNRLRSKLQDHTARERGETIRLRT